MTKSQKAINVLAKFLYVCSVIGIVFVSISLVFEIVALAIWPTIENSETLAPIFEEISDSALWGFGKMSLIFGVVTMVGALVSTIFGLFFFKSIVDNKYLFTHEIAKKSIVYGIVIVAVEAVVTIANSIVTEIFHVADEVVVSSDSGLVVRGIAFIVLGVVIHAATDYIKSAKDND